MFNFLIDSCLSLLSSPVDVIDWRMHFVNSWFHFIIWFLARVCADDYINVFMKYWSPEAVVVCSICCDTKVGKLNTTTKRNIKDTQDHLCRAPGTRSRHSCTTSHLKSALFDMQFWTYLYRRGVALHRNVSLGKIKGRKGEVLQLSHLSLTPLNHSNMCCES